MMEGFAALLERVLTRDPATFNTDWDGTLVMRALQEWEAATGESRYGDFVARWFQYHRDHDLTLSDEEFYRTFSGPRCEIIRHSPIPFTAYCGHWGLGYVCAALEGRITDGTPRRLAAAIADYLLHRAARSSHGALFHDDGTTFLIPDTCFFAAPVLAIAARLTGRKVYLEQAICQLRSYARLLQDKATGLALTLWSREGAAPVFWSRASGWLAGAFAGTLEHVPQSDENFPELADRFRHLATALGRVQRADGGFHVLLDQPETPVDSTAPAMIAMAITRGVQAGLLPQEHTETAAAAWADLQRHLTGDGRVIHAYTGWAKTALAGQFSEALFDAPRDFVTGLVLWTAALFAREDNPPKRNIPEQTGGPDPASGR